MVTYKFVDVRSSLPTLITPQLEVFYLDIMLVTVHILLLGKHSQSLM